MDTSKLTSQNWPFPFVNGKPIKVVVVKKQHPTYPSKHEDALL